jgi:hypothetical protein
MIGLTNVAGSVLKLDSGSFAVFLMMSASIVYMNLQHGRTRLYWD